jgi:hypothetical protein
MFENQLGGLNNALGVELSRTIPNLNGMVDSH